MKLDFRGLGVVTRASEPALRYTLAASRQKKLWQVVELFYENQAQLDELATDKGVKRMVKGFRGSTRRLVADAKSLSVRKQAAAHAAEAVRRNVPGRPGSSSRSATRPRSSSSPRPTTARRSAPSSTTRSAGERPALRARLALVSAAGIALAAYLTYVHYQPAALICTSGGGCETVQHSKYATIVGIPVAILGLAFWIAALVLVLWDSELARTLVVALAVTGIVFAAYLVVLQLFVIDAICTWCMLNDVVLAPLFLVLALARLWTGATRPRRPAEAGHHAYVIGTWRRMSDLDAVEDLRQALAGRRDAVVAETDHRVGRVRLASISSATASASSCVPHG